MSLRELMSDVGMLAVTDTRELSAGAAGYKGTTRSVVAVGTTMSDVVLDAGSTSGDGLGRQVGASGTRVRSVDLGTMTLKDLMSDVRVLIATASIEEVATR
jgi:hypothetical protein